MDRRPPPPFRLLAITPPTGPVEPELVDAWVEGAGDVPLALLLRTPEATGPETLEERRLAPIRQKAKDAGLTLLISCDFSGLDGLVPMLGDAGVSGVSLRADPPVHVLTAARSLLGGSLLGRSCHGLPQLGDDLVDFTTVAPVFEPHTLQPGRVKGQMGLQGLRRWTAEERRTVFALGGMSPAQASSVLDAGAHGIAGIGTFFGAPEEVVENVRALADAVRQSTRD